MKLEQGQIWKKDDIYLRIVHWARLSIEYKAMKDPLTKEGTVHQVTKKEFCRLLKGAMLLTPKETADNPEGDGEDDGDAAPGESQSQEARPAKQFVDPSSAED